MEQINISEIKERLIKKIVRSLRPIGTYYFSKGEIPHNTKDGWTWLTRLGITDNRKNASFYDNNGNHEYLVSLDLETLIKVYNIIVPKNVYRFNQEVLVVTKKINVVDVIADSQEEAELKLKALNCDAVEDNENDGIIWETSYYDNTFNDEKYKGDNAINVKYIERLDD